MAAEMVTVVGFGQKRKEIDAGHRGGKGRSRGPSILKGTYNSIAVRPGAKGAFSAKNALHVARGLLGRRP